VQGLPVFCAIAGLATDGPDTITVITTPNAIAVAVAATAARTALIVVALCIADLLTLCADSFGVSQSAAEAIRRLWQREARTGCIRRSAEPHP
jgi:hypothetical protein